MIKKINTIQKLGIFEDYSVDGNLENFAKFNLIYGWNGSGKTTFSELFKAFKSGELEEFPDLKYTIVRFHHVIPYFQKPHSETYQAF